MHKKLLVICSLLLAVSVSARADTTTNYTITFTTLFGPAPTSGSFTYDSTTPAFSNFLVVWDGDTFDLTAAANSPIIGLLTGCTSEASTAAYGFEIMSQTLTGCSVYYQWQGGELFNFLAFTGNPGQYDFIDATTSGAATGDFAYGDWTITSVTATPETSTMALLLIGCLALLLCGPRGSSRDVVTATKA